MKILPLTALLASLLIATPATAQQVFKDCADCPEMVSLPAGNFMMGSNHKVTLNAFALGKTEVTQGQWKAIMGGNPSNFSSCGDDCPVEKVSWDDAQEFIFKLNKKTGKKYRLPSESEWEYACLAGTDDDYCGGSSVQSVGWLDTNGSGRTHPVARKEANAWGLYDMSGNVQEWTQDCWNSSHKEAPPDGRAMKGGDCGRRVVRGGSWGDASANLRAASRNRDEVDTRYNVIGFRLAQTLP